VDTLKYSLDPIVGAGSRVLILGTLPGERSLAAQAYYAHSRNQFWPIMYSIFGQDPGRDMAERAAFIRRQRLALWDVLHSAEREGSLDVDIRNGVPNDFAAFLAEHPAIRAIALNGSKAHQIFARRCWLALGAALQARLSVHSLPSTSPAHTMAFERKLAAWGIVRELAEQKD
jgi:double-stranded uracil-DNA glycosylase